MAEETIAIVFALLVLPVALYKLLFGVPVRQQSAAPEVADVPQAPEAPPTAHAKSGSAVRDGASHATIA